jgi:hypothetical protein
MKNMTMLVIGIQYDKIHKTILLAIIVVVRDDFSLQEGNIN